MWKSAKQEPEKEGLYAVIDENDEVYTAWFQPDIDNEWERWGHWVSTFDMDTGGWRGSEWEPLMGVTHWIELPERENETQTER